jgi:hypothetical protein
MWVGFNTFWRLFKNFAQSGSVVYRLLGSHENTKEEEVCSKRI